VLTSVAVNGFVIAIVIVSTKVNVVNIVKTIARCLHLHPLIIVPGLSDGVI